MTLKEKLLHTISDLYVVEISFLLRLFYGDFSSFQASGGEGTLPVPVLLVPVHAQMQPQDAHRAGAQGRVGEAKHTAGIQESPHPPGANANVIIHRQCS